MEWIEEALEMALRAIDNENLNNSSENDNNNNNNNNDDDSNQSCNPIKNVVIKEGHDKNEININEESIINKESDNNLKNSKELLSNCNNNNEPIYQNLNELIQNDGVGNNDEDNSNKMKALKKISSLSSANKTNQTQDIHQRQQQPQQSLNGIKNDIDNNDEPYYQVPKSSEPLYEVPKYQKPVPVYENIEIFYSNMNGDGLNGIDENFSLNNTTSSAILMEPPKEKPPPPPIDDENDDENEISIKNGDDYNNTITTTATATVAKQNILSPIKQKNYNNQHEQQQEQEQINNDQSLNNNDNTSSPNKNGQSVKRMNSTKRIKKELRNKRSSFLGIEGNNNDDDIYLELTVAPPPDMAQLLQEERRLEKQLYMKAGLYDSSDTGDSRDSGVSENHSRQSSEPFTNSSEEHEDLLIKKEKEIIEVLEKEEKKQKTSENWIQQQHQYQQQQQQQQQDNNAKIQCIEDQIREQEEVLRVERELLQLEQEELKRQRENLIIRENLARKELEYGAKMLMSANHHNTRSLQDINNASLMTTPTTPATTIGTGNAAIVSATNHYANIPNRIYQVDADYRKSMSDLPTSDLFNQKRIPPAPPAKPLRSNLNANNVGLVKIANSNNGGLTSRVIHHSQSTDEFVPLRNYQQTSALHHGNMTRHTLLALSATPKPKYTDGWVQSTTMASSKTKSLSSDKSIDNWLSYQQKRKSIPDGFNYNKHWLIQEAEQRRIDQQRALRNSNTNSNTNHLRNYNSSNNNNNNNNSNNNGGSSSAIQKNLDNKPLPDAVIQTITQRIQSKGLGERKRLDQPPPPSQITTTNDSLLTTVSTTPSSPPPMNPLSLMLPDGQQEKILSVSGKKKCSHCGEELGRGAAMIIESLRLFYHINCFKCCVCHVQLGDGLNGTDVRVRNHKLHCHNCYSSDDGIKFSCV